ncbi:MAG: helix-turn-helix transcriptional regulator [Clostridia bacterium]|nr:helix-turn-helix transcriptional regulator [Clostridia bacterium]
MNDIVHMQSQFRSDFDRSSVCNFDVEVIEAPTKPLIHQMSRFLLIKKGRGRMKLQGIGYDLRPGTVVSILPWQTSDVIEVAEPLEYYLLKYYFDGINNIVKSFYNIGNDTINLIEQITRHPVIQCDAKHEAVMDELFLQIRKEIGSEIRDKNHDEQNLRNIYLANKLVEIVLQFYRIGGLLEAGGADASHAISNTEIIQYIYNHLSEKLTLKDLSTKFFLCESSVSHYIKSTTGLSFFDLINEMRIGKTINFLLYTDLTMDELAEILGFVDSAHISKVFMSRIGMKASDYRKTYQKVNDICKIKETKASYKIIDYIYRNYMEAMTPKSVADRFHMTTRQLNLILLYQVERNYEDFLNFVRINRGTELLLSTDLSITDIAMAIGYNTVKTFTRNFLKFRLMPPAVFRRTTELQEDDLL